MKRVTRIARTIALPFAVILVAGACNFPMKGNIAVAGDEKGTFLRVYASPHKGNMSMQNTGAEMCTVTATSVTCKDLNVVLPN